MTVATDTQRVSYAGNGTTTVFAYSWLIYANTELEVTLVSSAGVETVKTLTTHYTVSGVGAGSGSVTMLTAPATGETLIIRRVVPLTQGVDVTNQSTFYPATFEQALDKTVMIDQQQQEELDRALKKPVGGANYDAGSAKIANVATPTASGDAVPLGHLSSFVSAAVAALSDPALTTTITSATATAGQTAFTVSTYIPGVNNISVYRQGVRQRLNTDYAETNSTTITLTTAAIAGEVFQFIIDERTTSGDSYSAGNTTYTQGGAGSVSTNVQDVLRARGATFFDFGAVADDASDNAAEIQAAIDYCSANGVPLFGPYGSFRVASSINWKSNLTLIMHPDCKIKRNFATTEATFTQASPGTPLTNVRVFGGHVTTVNSSQTGPAVFLHADDAVLRGVRVTEFYSGGTAGQAFVIGGDRFRIAHCDAITADTSIGTGAFRYFGGEDFLGSDLYAECGDDCFQFVPVAETSSYGDLTIKRGRYVNCWGKSAAARVAIAALGNPATTDAMTASILDCAFIGVGGRGTKRVCYVDNQDSSGQIRRIRFVGCQWDGTDNTTLDSEVLVTNTNGAGGTVSDISFVDCDVKGPRRGVLKVDGADRVTWTRGEMDAPRSGTAGISQVIFQDTEDSWIERAVVALGASVADGIHFGVSGSVATRCRAIGCTVRDVDDGQLGIRDAFGVDCTIEDNSILGASGETTGTGVSVASTALRTYVDNNDVRQINGTKLSINATGNPKVFPNRGQANRQSGKATLASGTASVTFDEAFSSSGYAILLTGAVAETFTFASPATTGFTINSDNASSTATVSWLAILEDV